LCNNYKNSVFSIRYTKTGSKPYLKFTAIDYLKQGKLIKKFIFAIKYLISSTFKRTASHNITIYEMA